MCSASQRDMAHGRRGDPHAAVPGYVISRCDRRGGKSGGGVAIIYRSTMIAEPFRVPAATSALESLWLRLSLTSPIIVGAFIGRRRVRRLRPSMTCTASWRVSWVVISQFTCSETPISTFRGRRSRRGVIPAAAERPITDAADHGSDSLRTESIADRSPDHHKPELTTNARVVPCNISNYDPISASVSVVKTRHVVNTISLRSTRRVNTDALRLDMLHADWSPIYAAVSASDKWSSFLQTWSPIIDAHMPVHTIKLRHRLYPWLQDDDVREEMAARDQGAHRSRANALWRYRGRISGTPKCRQDGSKPGLRLNTSRPPSRTRDRGHGVTSVSFWSPPERQRPRPAPVEPWRGLDWPTEQFLRVSGRWHGAVAGGRRQRGAAAAAPAACL